MLVALKEHHRRCEQHLEHSIFIKKNRTVQSLGQSSSKDIFEKVRAEYIPEKTRFKEKRQIKLNSFTSYPQLASSKNKLAIRRVIEEFSKHALKGKTP